MKHLFTIAAYSDYRQNIFNTYVSPRNKEFCKKHNYKYTEIKDLSLFPNIRNHPSWLKYYIIDLLVDQNKLKDGDVVTYIDADQYFVDIDHDLIPSKTLSLSIDSGNTFCHSWNSLKINTWSRKHIKNMTNETLYLKHLNNFTTHPAFPDSPPSSFVMSHMEQAIFYILCGIKRHSDISFWKLPKFGFHSEITEDTVYSLEELEENVEIFPTEFNVTEWENESSCMFNINKVKKENVIIRHFAGGQKWEESWFKTF